MGTREIPEEISDYIKGKLYAIIIHLKDAEKVEPFEIDKTGYGLQAAWLVVDDLQKIKKVTTQSH